jgi:hypothetical protein
VEIAADAELRNLDFIGAEEFAGAADRIILGMR